MNPRSGICARGETRLPDVLCFAHVIDQNPALFLPVAGMDAIVEEFEMQDSAGVEHGRNRHGPLPAFFPPPPVGMPRTRSTWRHVLCVRTPLRAGQDRVQSGFMFSEPLQQQEGKPAGADRVRPGHGGGVRVRGALETAAITSDTDVPLFRLGTPCASWDTSRTRGGGRPGHP